jgi:hypothetical protein
MTTVKYRILSEAIYVVVQGGYRFRDEYFCGMTGQYKYTSE